MKKLTAFFAALLVVLVCVWQVLPGAEASVATVYAIQAHATAAGAFPSLMYVPVLENAVVGANTALLSVNPATVYEPRNNMIRVIVDWVSDTNGNATYFVPGPVSGVLLKAYAFPATGTFKPSDNYDVSLKAILPTSYGEDTVADEDLASSGLANIDADGSVDIKSFWPTTVITIPERLQVEISNAGSQKSGRLILYVYRNP